MWGFLKTSNFFPRGSPEDEAGRALIRGQEAALLTKP